MRLTTIVATLGPSSSSPDVIEKMIRSGVDVFRLNFSHGTHDEHTRLLETVRAAGKRQGRTVAILQDLCGPKIRVGTLREERVELTTGGTVRLRRGTEPGDEHAFGSSYPSLIDDLKVGSPLLIDDGAIVLVVLERTDDEVLCRVNAGGTLRPHKGINLPGVSVSAPSVTEKDFDDLRWGIAHGVDYVALSFVRSADDVRTVKRFLHEHGHDVPVIAKIEKPEAVERIEEIVSVSDGGMVARGDLGVEMRLEVVPILQKRIIRLCTAARKPVITATQMLQSMTDHPVPTRAEVSDVANAILDGSDAVMLSGETAVGDYPVQSVCEMARIAEETDRFAGGLPHPGVGVDPDSPVSSSLTHAVAELVRTMKPVVVVVSSASGYTARNLSKERLPVPVLALSDSEETCRRMALYRGTISEHAREDSTLEALVSHAERTIREKQLAQGGELFVLVAGFPVGKPGTTNTVQVRRLPTETQVAKGVDGRAKWTRKEPAGDTDTTIDYGLCIGCGACVRECPFDIYAVEGEHAVVNEKHLVRCIGDLLCVRGCPTGAIAITRREQAPSLERGR